jgi:hypothetical protein
MLKNIEQMRDRGLTIQQRWLVPEIYAFDIPFVILKGLGLKSIGEKEQASMSPKRKSCSPTKSRDKSANKILKSHDAVTNKESKSTMAQTITMTIDNNYDESRERRA